MNDLTKRTNPFKSSVAAAVAAAFFFSTVFAPVAEANFWQERRQAARQETSSDNQDLYAQLPANLIPAVGTALPGAALPKDLAVENDARRAHIPSWLRALPAAEGEVRAVHLTKNPSRDPLVVLIQDVHEVESAQRAIAAVIGHVEREAAKANLGPVLVGLEGAAGPLDFAPFRAKIGTPLHKDVTEVLLRSKVLSGPEYHAFLSEKESRQWGVETPANYLANVQAYKDAHPTVKELNALLGRLDQALAAKKGEVFSPELRTLDQALAAYADGKSSIVAYVGALSRGGMDGLSSVNKLLKALEAEKGLDFRQVETERASLVEALARKADKKSLEKLLAAALAHRAGQIGYGAYHAHLKKFAASQGIRWAQYPAFEKYTEYVLLAESIDKFGLFTELETLKARALEKTAKAPAEKNLMEMAEGLRLIGRLARHEFSPEEWAAFASRRAELEGMEARIAEAAGAKNSGRLAALLPAFERFYTAADSRNAEMVNNLAARAKAENSRVRVLVAGGFHTPGLEKILKAQGSSFVTITPAVGEIPAGDKYLDVFVSKHVPIEQMLLGQKLFLALERRTAAPMGDGHRRGDVGTAYRIVEKGFQEKLPAIGPINTFPGGAANLGPLGSASVLAQVTEMVKGWARWWAAPSFPREGFIGRIPRWVWPAGLVLLAVAGAAAGTGFVLASMGVFGVTGGQDPAVPGSVERLAADLRAAQALNSRAEWENGSADPNAPEGALAEQVYSHVAEFVADAKAREAAVKDMALGDTRRQAAYLDILRGITYAVALPQITFAIPADQREHARHLRNELEELWIRVGKDLEMPRINGIEAMLQANDDVVNKGVREVMAQANIVHAPQTQINALPPDVWSPYSAELWAPYMTADVLADLILGLPYDLNARGGIEIPAGVHRGIAEHVLANVAVDKTDPSQRLLAFADFEASILKAPEQGLALAKALGIAAGDMTAFEAFSRDFKRAMTFVKRYQLWEAKKGQLGDEAGETARVVREALGERLGPIDDQVLTMRLVVLNRPWPIIAAAARGEIRPAESFKSEVPPGLAGVVPLAAGAASRWADSMIGYVKAGLMTEEELAALKGPRQTTAHWVGRLNGIALGIDSMAANGGGRQSFLVSPFTFPEIFEEVWRQRARQGDAGRRVTIEAIVQNSGEALIINSAGRFLTDDSGNVRRLDGKVLGHGNIRGFPLGMLSALAGGQVYGLVRSGDAPLAQIHHPAFQGLIRRLVSDAAEGQPRVHVAVGNWRAPGQTGGGFVDVFGVPNVVDTRIPKKPNAQGFVADRDITVFSTFENVLNYAGILYAVAGDITTADGEPLITWSQYADVSAGREDALNGLSRRINGLTTEQVLTITNRYINLLPSEYVEKKEGDTLYVQWEQISGMLHGQLAAAVDAAKAREGVSGRGGHTFAYIDISLDERDVLNYGDPTFAEVKSGPGLSAIKEAVAGTVIAAAENGLFSPAVRQTAVQQERRAFAYEIGRRIPDYQELPAAQGVLRVPSFVQLGAMPLTVPPVGGMAGSFATGRAGEINSPGEAKTRVADGQVVVFEKPSPQGTTQYLYVPTPDYQRELAQSDRRGPDGFAVSSHWVAGILAVLLVAPFAGAVLAVDPGTLAALTEKGPQILTFLQVVMAFALGGAIWTAFWRYSGRGAKEASSPKTFYSGAAVPRWNDIIPPPVTHLDSLTQERANFNRYLMQGARNLTDDVGYRLPDETARGLVVDRATRALLLSGAQPSGELPTAVRNAFSGFIEKLAGGPALYDAWRRFSAAWSAGAPSFQPIDDLKLGVVRTVLLDDPHNIAMVEDALAMAERYNSEEGQSRLRRVPNMALVIIIDPVVEKTLNAEQLSRFTAANLVQARVKVLRTDAPSAAGLVTQRADGMREIGLGKVIGLIGRDPSQVLVEVIASPVSTVVFTLDGMRKDMVSFLVWVLAGTAVPVTDTVEKSLRSLALALKNA